ncbi:energy transducer TonB [Xenorhabdus japonica]|uniref:Protein TonB n=1 Tax=Xenorhabdus japonica TaxID=53341 RepID=A0A1I5B280_9GAMM|nr:energy transducer TonB [Xenorhabdus japonica]SFN68782.1 outer membrane transport energization protein TonB [Xenorhabdus japonica]
MTSTAILDNPATYSPLMPRKGLLVGILIAILLHISLIWLFNRHASYDDTAHHINNNSSTTGLSITMVAASSWENKPEPVSPPTPLLTAPESPIKPEIVLDKAIPTENTVAKPLEINKPKKRKKQQREKQQEIAEKKPTPSPQVQENNNAEQVTSGSAQINSESSMSRAVTSQPLVGQGNSEMDNYHARLRQEIERHKRYPRKAKRMKQEGSVIVNFTLLDDGTLTATKVINSSGNSTLDNAALDAINRAISVGPKPADMASVVTLELDFMLDKTR